MESLSFTNWTPKTPFAAAPKSHDEHAAKCVRGCLRPVRLARLQRIHARIWTGRQQRLDPVTARKSIGERSKKDACSKERARVGAVKEERRLNTNSSEPPYLRPWMPKDSSSPSRIGVAGRFDECPAARASDSKRSNRTGERSKGSGKNDAYSKERARAVAVN